MVKVWVGVEKVGDAEVVGKSVVEKRGQEKR